MATTEAYDLGQYTFPRGWFMIADGSQITRKPAPIRFFGQDMVIYRGDSGRVVVLDAYCPHMGAHFAENSTSYIVMDNEQIEGDSIRCPYHGWRFNPSGQCDDVPYSPTPPPPSACVQSWPVTERGNCVFIWQDPEGGDPDYEVPALPEWGDREWAQWKIEYLGDIDTHPIEVVDNMVDKAHFQPIHGSGETEYFENIFDQHIVRQEFAATHKTLSEEVLYSSTWYTGPAILMSRMEGTFPSIVQITHTPIEDGKIRVWIAVLVKTGLLEDAAQSKAIADGYHQAQRDALMQDYEIWAHKRPCLQPLAVPGDGPFRRLRQWYSQFYRPRSEAPAIQSKLNGTISTKGTTRNPWPDKS